MSKIDNAPTPQPQLGLQSTRQLHAETLFGTGLNIRSARPDECRSPSVQHLAQGLSSKAAEALLELSGKEFRFRLPTSAYRQLLDLGLVEHSGMISWRRTKRGQAVRAALGWELAKWAGQQRTSSAS